jgi:hypothetical protein
LRVAAAFFAAVDRLALLRLRVAAAFFAAGRFRAVVFLRATVLLAGRRFAALFFALLLFLAIAMRCPLSLRSLSISGRHAFQASPFPFAHPTPHAVPLIATECVVQALDANGTLATDPLGLPR